MKYTLILFCFFIFSFGFAQNQNNDNITLEFENLSKLEVIEQLENVTNYHFYFLESWLDDNTISLQFTNASINQILNQVFKSTNINYYISPKKDIFLTQNSLINSKLPDDYFNINKNNNSEDLISPILYSNLVEAEESVDETVRIGKESNNNKQKTYVLSGYVKNKTTNKPISDLTIITSDKKINTLTDKNGYYSIELPYGVNYIETTGLGFSNSKKRVVIYSNGTLNFNLTDEIEVLDEIVIEADKDQNTKSVLTGVLQIKTQAIKTVPLVLGERDILKVATTLPGITTAGEGSSGYNVRGGKEDQNLILLDNAVLYNPSHFFGIFSALNPFTSGDVNIYKGNIPSEFGGRLSSVFDIKTKNGDLEKLAVEASIGPVTSNINVETPIVKNKSSLMVGARGTYSGWILRSLDDESLKNSEASFYDIVGKYNQKLNDKNDLEATVYYSKDAFSITSDSLFSYSNRLMSLKWDHTFDEKNIGNIILSNSEYKFNIEFDSDFDRNFDLGYRVNETEFKLRMKYLMNKKHKFDYGISSKLYAVNPGSIRARGSQSIVEDLVIPKERALESALYLSDNIEFNDKLSINLGIRYSFFASLGESEQRIYQENTPKNAGSLIETKEFGKNEIIETYGGPEFRLSARYFLGENLSLKGSFNSTYQYIHTLSNNTTLSPTDTWKLSDANIKPQQANQFSLGLYKNFDGNNYEISLEGYYKKSENILDYKVGAELILNEAIETEVLQGEGKAYGVEFLVRKNKGRFNGWLGYTYSRSFIKLDSEFAEERVNNGEYFPSNFDKPHDLSLVANYKLTKRFSLSTNFTYQTGRPVTFPTGKFILNGAERVLYSNRNEFRIPDYYRLDLGLNIEGNHKTKKLAHSFWNISVYNVLGRNNPYSVFFVTEGGEIQAYQSSIFAIPVPTITYNLKF